MKPILAKIYLIIPPRRKTKPILAKDILCIILPKRKTKPILDKIYLIFILPRRKTKPILKYTVPYYFNFTQEENEAHLGNIRNQESGRRSFSTETSECHADKGRQAHNTSKVLHLDCTL
jgi:hypothetical protein